MRRFIWRTAGVKRIHSAVPIGVHGAIRPRLELGQDCSVVSKSSLVIATVLDLPRDLGEIEFKIRRVQDVG
jgi:hypothetical protein